MKIRKLPVHSVLDMALTSKEPLRQIRRTMGTLENGQVLYICVNSKSAFDDLLSWCHQVKHNVLSTDNTSINKYACHVQKSDPYLTQNELTILDQRCPVPVVEAAHNLQTLANGEILKMTSNCHSVIDDVRSWICNTPHSLLDIYETYDGQYIFYIQKRTDSKTQAA